MQVTNKPLDAVTKANEMGANEPNKLCSLFIVHSKFFNITKDPFAATLFKTAQVLVSKQITLSQDFHSVMLRGVVLFCRKDHRLLLDAGRRAAVTSLVRNSIGTWVPTGNGTLLQRQRTSINFWTVSSRRMAFTASPCGQSRLLLGLERSLRWAVRVAGYHPP